MPYRQDIRDKYVDDLNLALKDLVTNRVYTP